MFSDIKGKLAAQKIGWSSPLIKNTMLKQASVLAHWSKSVDYN